MEAIVAQDSISETADRGTFERFRESIDPVWIEEALAATGTASVRRRRLPAEQAFWLVIGMALFRDLPIVAVVNHLKLTLPGTGVRKIAPSAVMQARARLGEDPIKYLFERTTQEWALTSARDLAWRDLAVFGIDATTVRVPDSPENREEFGGQRGRHGDYGGYPQLRVATLMALRSHELAGVCFGPYGGERPLAKKLFDKLPERSLVVVDRGFAYPSDMIPIEQMGGERHWLTRARKDQRWKVAERLGAGDAICEMTLSRSTRTARPGLPAVWRFRTIEYKRKGFRGKTLLTSLMDAQRYPAAEIIALYHERWEIELGFDEVKTEMLERQESIRSKTPAGVRQEFWGILLAYNLIRAEMLRAAVIANVAPTRISFKASLRAVKYSLVYFALITPGNLPKVLERLHDEIAECVLPPRRSHRIYPRAVKIKMSNYPRKRTPGTRGRRRAAK
jgi:Insertion element 4 transposase N-terminal/Transposase DDE domain